MPPTTVTMPANRSGPNFSPNTILDAAEPTNGVTIGPGMTVDEAEQKLILVTLDAASGNKTRAAEMLGISLKTLHNKLNRFKESGASSASGPSGASGA